MFFITCFLVFFAVQAREHSSVKASLSESFHDQCPKPVVCVSPTLTGLDWLISQRNEDYGWGQETHRAIIALAVNHFRGFSKTESDLMKYQLEVELTKALLRNKSRTNGEKMSTSDLSLYIHALIATERDPRDFYGVNLVSLLLDSTQTEDSQPFLLLALCNVNSLSNHHVHSLHRHLQTFLKSGTPANMEFFAIALKALACAVDGVGYKNYDGNLKIMANHLAHLHNEDGSFGNIYTTALVIQALVASKIEWNEDLAIKFLEERKAEALNIVSVYLMEMAFNAKNVTFLKQLTTKSSPVSENGFPSISELLRWPKEHFVQYSIKIGKIHDIYHSITMKVSSNITFYDVMRLAAHEDSKFNFSYELDEHGKPIVYAVSGVPNDVEDGLYWRLIVEQRLNGTRPAFVSREITRSPASLNPHEFPGAHFVFWYLDVFQPLPGSK